MAKRGPDTGSSPSWPLRTRWENPGQARGSVREDVAFDANPWAIVDRKADFDGSFETFTVTIPLTTDSGVDEQATTGANVGYGRVPRAGYLISAQYVGEDTLAANDSNYLTFAVTNKLGSGSGSTAMLAAGAGNTTQATGGTGVTAIIGRSLTIHGTAVNLQVAAGDVILASETPTGTLANAIDKPQIVLTFATVPVMFTPRITRTAGSPLVGPVANTANGEIICQLEATSEAQYAGIDFNDQLVIPAGKGCVFSALVKFGTIGANEIAVVGLCSAFNATLDNIIRNVWFKLDGGMTLVVETDDNTTDTDDTACSPATTITAGTYYFLTVDMTRPGKIRFYVNNNKVAEITTAAAFDGDTNGLQPIIGVQKASGTGTPSVTVDFERHFFNRV